MASSEETHPCAIAPTKTTIECVSGIVGRYFESRTGVASNERAAHDETDINIRSLTLGLGLRVLLTDFVRVDRKMVGDWVLGDVCFWHVSRSQVSFRGLERPSHGGASGRVEGAPD